MIIPGAAVSRAPRPDRPRGVGRHPRAHPGRPRRLRRRPHVSAPPSCGTHRRTSMPYNRRRARGDDARAIFSAIREMRPCSIPARRGTARRAGARQAFDATLAFLDTARASGGGPATFLLGRVPRLRTFESFPGLRTVLRTSSAHSQRAATSCWPAAIRRGRCGCSAKPRARSRSSSVTPLTTAEIRSTLPSPVDGAGAPNALREAEVERAHDELARLVHALSDGRPAYDAAIADTSATLDPNGADPVSALSALLAQDGALDRRCRFWTSSACIAREATAPSRPF